jgi:hypothetical protein
MILGCTVRVFGGCVEDLVVPVEKGLFDAAKWKDGSRKRQEERERFGKVGKSSVESKSESAKYIQFLFILSFI